MWPSELRYAYLCIYEGPCLRKDSYYQYNALDISYKVADPVPWWSRQINISEQVVNIGHTGDDYMS